MALSTPTHSQESYDAVIVPGGGLGSSGEVPPWVANRLDRAMEHSRGSNFIIVLSAGTPHKPPPLDRQGKPILECVAEARYLLERGFDSGRILMENASYDTIGNAYFCRVIHVEPAGFRRLLIVTSEFHAPRTELIFRWIFGLTPQRLAYQLSFESSANVGMSAEVLRARHKKEAESLKSLPNLAARYTTLPDFHRWLFAEHGAYRAAPSVNHHPGDAILLQSY